MFASPFHTESKSSNLLFLFLHLYFVFSSLVLVAMIAILVWLFCFMLTFCLCNHIVKFNITDQWKSVPLPLFFITIKPGVLLCLEKVSMTSEFEGQDGIRNMYGMGIVSILSTLKQLCLFLAVHECFQHMMSNARKIWALF